MESVQCPVLTLPVLRTAMVQITCAAPALKTPPVTNGNVPQFPCIISVSLELLPLMNKKELPTVSLVGEYRELNNAGTTRVSQWVLQFKGNK